MNLIHPRTLLGSLSLAVACLSLVTPAGTWTGATDTEWTTSGNWSGLTGGSAYPGDGVGDYTATFSSGGTASLNSGTTIDNATLTQVNLNGAATPTVLNLNGATLKNFDTQFGGNGDVTVNFTSGSWTEDSSTSGNVAMRYFNNLGLGKTYTFNFGGTASFVNTHGNSGKSWNIGWSDSRPDAVFNMTGGTWSNVADMLVNAHDNGSASANISGGNMTVGRVYMTDPATSGTLFQVSNSAVVNANGMYVYDPNGTVEVTGGTLNGGTFDQRANSTYNQTGGTAAFGSWTMQSGTGGTATLGGGNLSVTTLNMNDLGTVTQSDGDVTIGTLNSGNDSSNYTLSGGTLTVNSATLNNTGAGAFQVSGGATLQLGTGSQIFTDGLEILAGGMLGAGDNSDLYTPNLTTGDLLFRDGASLDFSVNGLTSAADLWNVDTNLRFEENGTYDLVLNVLAGDVLPTDEFVIFDFSDGALQNELGGALDFNSLTFTVSPGGTTRLSGGTVNLVGNTLVLSDLRAYAIPEPSSLMLLVMGAAFIGRRRLLKRRA